MTEYAVTLKRTPGLSDDEVRARLGRVYRLLLEIAKREKTVGNPKPSTAGNARLQADATGSTTR